MLATLYGKALDADAPSSILRDHYAKAAVARIDYGWEATGINARQAPSVAIRTLHFDNWTRQFLAVHEQVTVLHVGCGLDARVHRLDPPAGVRWYDMNRWLGRAIAAVTPLRKIGQYHRYAFGPPEIGKR
jgi:O-methyltransferase involved in polyketide biosynthesis